MKSYGAAVAHASRPLNRGLHTKCGNRQDVDRMIERFANGKVRRRLIAMELREAQYKFVPDRPWPPGVSWCRELPVRGDERKVNKS